MAQSAHVRRDAAGTRGRILAIAAELFAERGYAGTSIRDIAERLGVTKAAVYYHFPAKDRILDALVEPLRAGVEGLAARAPGMAPGEIIDELVAIMAGPGAVLRACVEDPSAKREIADHGIVFDFDALGRAIAGTGADAEREVRARCAIGAIFGGMVRAPETDAAAALDLEAAVGRAARAALGEPS